MTTPFTSLVNDPINKAKVWSDEHCVAFVANPPQAIGHCLVVPRIEVDYWLDAHDALLCHLIQTSQYVAKGIQMAYSPLRVAMLIAGMQVPHLHIHLIPVSTESDLNITHPLRKLNSDELLAIASKIINHISLNGC